MISPSFSKLCADLGCPLTNVLDRWSGLSRNRRRAIFNVWADHLVNGRYLFVPDGPLDTRVGARELREHIDTVMREGAEALGILCEAIDVHMTPRKRGRVHDETTLVLGFRREVDGIVAYVIGEVPFAVALEGPIAASMQPFDGAIDDLDQPPPGGSKTNRMVNAYRRDKAVRDRVIERAKGVCEHCGSVDFLTEQGHPYLEAHHVIRLADQGPDTVRNVIALCSRHHREAHYGQNGAALEIAFLRKLADINGESSTVLPAVRLD